MVIKNTKSQKNFLASIVISTTLVFATIGNILPPVIHAQKVTSSTTISKVINEQDRILTLKNKGDDEIAKRIDNLRKLVSKTNNLKKLTLDQKNTLSNNINNEINNLNNLKVKVDGETDLTALKLDIKAIIQSYRVYALYIPQTWIIVSADKIADINSSFNNITSKLNARIQTYQFQGKDVSMVQAAYNDLLSKVTDASTRSQDAIKITLPLTPDGYPVNKVQLLQGRSDVKTGYTDLVSARQDIKIIIEGLKK